MASSLNKRLGAFPSPSARVAYVRPLVDVLRRDKGLVSKKGSALLWLLGSNLHVAGNTKDAIKVFKAPTGEPKPGGEVPLARFHASAARDYLTAHGPALAKVLSTAGAGEVKELGQQLDALALVLEPVEKVELLARGDATGLKLMLRVKTVKPLKK